MQKYNHYFAIDLTKLLLAVFVVGLHSQPLFRTEAIDLTTSRIFDLAVPLFFAFSGFFFAIRFDLKKSIKNLMSIYLFYLIFSWPLCVTVYRDLDWIAAIQRTLFMGPLNIGWYAVTLMWCMTIIWALNRLKSKKTARLIASILSISLYIMCISQFSYRPILQDSIIGSIDTFYKMIFYTIAWSVPQGLIFFLTGVIVYRNNIKFNLHTSLFIAAIGLALYFGEFALSEKTGIMVKSINFSLPLATFGLLSLLLSLCKPLPYVDLGKKCRQASTMMYFSHPMIMFIIYRTTGINVGWHRFILTLAIIGIVFAISQKLSEYKRFNWIKYAY